MGLAEGSTYKIRIGCERASKSGWIVTDFTQRERRPKRELDSNCQRADSVWVYTIADWVAYFKRLRKKRLKTRSSLGGHRNVAAGRWEEQVFER